MADGVDVKELLGAYLAGDIRPEEREAVERLLASDPQARTVLENLRDVVGSVHASDVSIPETLSSQLRERLASFLADETTAAALGAALAGELTPAERELLKRFFREHPREKARMTAARQTGLWMKTQQPQAGDALSNALRERLAAKIPGLRREDVSRETTLVKTPKLPVSMPAAQARPLSQSLRVIAKDDPWKRRMAWAAGAAATVALAFGIARVFSGPPESIAKGTTPARTEEVVPPKNGGSTPEILPAPRTPAPDVAREDRIEKPDGGTNNTAPERVVQRDPLPVAPAPQPQNGQSQVAQTPQPRAVPQPRDVVEHEPLRQKQVPDVAAEDPKKITQPQNQQNAVAPGTPTPDASVADGRSKGGMPIGVTPPRPPSDTVAAAPSNTNNTTVPRTGADVGNGLTPGAGDPGPGVAAAPDADPAKKPAADGTSMIVASVSGGSVEARPENGDPQTLTSNQAGFALSSGTELVTSETSRITLDLPDGRLWVNVGSRVRIVFSGTSVSADLSGGQMAYEASKGSLAVSTAKQLVVTNAKNVDVRIENGAVVTSVLSDNAKVKGKNVTRGQQATVTNPASADAPKLGPLNTELTKWRGENDPLRTTTNEDPAKGKSKSKSRRR